MSEAEELRLTQLIETMANDNDKSGDGLPPWLMPVEKEGGEASRRSLLAPRALIAGLAIGVVALFAGLIWMMYSRSDAGPALVVQAPDEPFKVEPAERGGMAVPHQDKLVFDRVSGERSEVAEELLPSAETPLERPQVPALESGEVEPPAVVAETPAAAAPATVMPQPAAGLDATLPPDAWAVQIGAFRTNHTARAWAARQKTEREALLDGLQLVVQEGEKDRMTYYRVRIGPLASRQAALAKCGEVKEAGLNCLVVAPGG